MPQSLNWQNSEVEMMKMCGVARGLVEHSNCNFRNACACRVGCMLMLCRVFLSAAIISIIAADRDQDSLSSFHSNSVPINCMNMHAI